MPEVQIPFTEWSRNKLRKQLKIATTRTKPFGNKGDFFFVEEIKYEILQVTKMNLVYVAYNLFRTEGADSPEEFIKIWTEIHYLSGWTPDKKVYYHKFRRVE